VDSRLCISYLTIEKRGPIPEELAPGIGNHVFGCDICQDVCPWNGRAGISDDPRFSPAEVSRDLERLSTLNENTFRDLFRNSPVWRAKYEGFLRNVAIVMGNSRNGRMAAPLSTLTRHPNRVVAAAACQALEFLRHSN